MIAAKVVVALGDRGQARVADLEAAHERMHDLVIAAGSEDGKGAQAG